MDKIRQQKLEYFLLDLDGKIKEIRDYLLLDKGAVLLDAIANFEEENAEFLQYNSAGQDELNKRKWIIQYTIFPIIGDDKVEELLQYHILEPLDISLDLEELMRMRAITISELLWPKVSQQYLKALMQNTQLIGSESLEIKGEKNAYLPYVKNWISLYNRRFGIDKHTGLEPHQFVLEDPNAQKLGKNLKEKLLKVLKFYESLKVYSLSEIEGELRKMQMGFNAQQAAAYSLTKDKEKNPHKYPAAPPKQAATGASISSNQHTPSHPHPQISKVQSGRSETASLPKKPGSIAILADIQKEILRDKRIKFADTEYEAEEASTVAESGEAGSATTDKGPAKTKIVSKRDLEETPIGNLLEKYPALTAYKITDRPISLSVVPFSLSPTLQNWIQYYQKEYGKGKHSPQERESFMEQLKKSQFMGNNDLQKLRKIFRSLDEKTPLPFDKKNNELLLDLVKVGEKLRYEPATEIIEKKLEPVSASIAKPVMKMGAPTRANDDEGYLDLELVPTASTSKDPDLKIGA